MNLVSCYSKNSFPDGVDRKAYNFLLESRVKSGDSNSSII